MTGVRHTTDRAAKWMRYIARALALIWAGFWAIFIVGAILFDPLGGAVTTGKWDLLTLLAPLLVILFFGVPAAIPWLWEAVGGIVLVAAGFVAPIYFVVLPLQGYAPPSEIIGTSLLFGLPPLVAGFLFLASWWRSRRSGSRQTR